MGAKQSSFLQATTSQNEDGHNSKSAITVINEGGEIERTIKVALPARVKPILQAGKPTIRKQFPRGSITHLDPSFLSNITKAIDRYSNSKAELVAARQLKLHHQVLRVDDIVQRFTDSYIKDKHKALVAMNDDCKKIDRIRDSVDKCTVQTDICINMLNNLNSLLPESARLEELCW